MVDLVSFHSQSVFVSMSPIMLTCSASARDATCRALFWRPFMFCSRIRQTVCCASMLSPNALLCWLCGVLVG